MHHIKKAARVEAAGTPPKIIEEFVGRVNTGEDRLSIARMRSPRGWSEPFQRPQFDEYTLVLKGQLQVECDTRVIQVCAGEAVLLSAGERVRYSSPLEDCEYVAICLPAFSADTVHRED